ncbi:methylmalonyl-CoA mutase family protein [Planomicrobium sp. Y74]|uniref:methylmalonyl-CoA mutase family protein n=1 Tax=Planomicrobium sp. Y74 TaxID=2478977 RepID=UPI000EF4A7FE|nr:methylmalonyl-CoA mutase family protein [Planomicrobium sp. Y74]RLQ92157.1 methylmalonyl-CoA mutase [Planomicrobium sp. Y74]
MTIDSMKQTKFPKRTYEDWRQAAEKAIGGKPVDPTLKTQTIEGIELEPLYTKEMLEALGDLPAFQQEAVRSGKKEAGWLIAQEVLSESPQDFLLKTKEDLLKGNDMVVYTSSQEFIWSDQELEQLAELLVKYPFYFKLTSEDTDILRVFNLIDEKKHGQLKGVIFSEEEATAPGKVRTRLVDTIPVHHAGGTIVHELGVALSILAETIKEGNYKETAAKTWIRFAVDTQFFQEIAKLRAFRGLWKAFSEAYGEEAVNMPVYTETSVRSYSKLDPYVNLLRAGNASFAAVLGGTDAHTVHPHDFLTVSQPSSRRIARNVQLVIKEESHASRVLDASAGSYFIEHLTKEYIEASWNYFLEIEEAGGYSEVIKSGWLTDDIQGKWLEREKLAAERKISLIGTNIYANPQEAVKDHSIDSSHLEYITAKRLATPFEKLRARSREIELKVAIIHLGPLKEVKAKSDFVEGLLAVGGIEPEISPELKDAESLNKYLVEHAFDYAVLCGVQEKLEAIIPGISSSAVLDVAGKYPVEQMDSWKSNALSDAVYSGQNIVLKLEQILNLGKKAL